MENKGAGGFAGSALKGGLIGGILSSIPLLNILNCCFCLLNVGGAAAGISFHLNADPDQKMSNADAAVSGALSGAVTGVCYATIGQILSFLFNLVFGGLMMSILAMFGEAMEPILAQYAAQTGAGVLGIFVGMGWGICVGVPIYAVIGAVAGVATLNFGFKDRVAS